MIRLTHLLLGAWVCAILAAPAAASDAPIFRVFLTDGTEIASYGEFARLDEAVVLSVPAGGSVAAPRLQMVTLPAALVDWARTDRHAASLRYQRYAATRGEEDFARLTDEVAAVLGQIALSTDRPRALALAEEARRTLAEWPLANYGYRHREVREIVMVLDQAINSLRGQVSPASFDLSFVAAPPEVEPEPLRGMPTASEQIDQLVRLAALVPRATDRVALLQSARGLLGEPGVAPRADGAALARALDRQIRDETSVDARYLRLTERVMRDATRAAAGARVSDIERLLARVPREDARLGGRRPDIVQALQASLQLELDRARTLRLLRDSWQLRRTLYRDYQHMVSGQVAVLARMAPRLDAIRRLDGPSPDTLLTLRGQLAGGADRLERFLVPADLRGIHDLLVGAWRLAENAVHVRYDAAAAADVNAAWAASSAAAGSLMLLSRAQQNLAALATPPTIEDVPR